MSYLVGIITSQKLRLSMHDPFSGNYNVSEIETKHDPFTGYYSVSEIETKHDPFSGYYSEIETKHA